MIDQRSARGSARPRITRTAGSIVATLMLCAALDSFAVDQYIDAEGNMHYSNVAPEKGWQLLDSDVLGKADLLDSRRADAQRIAAPAFQRHVKRGDSSDQGLIVEVKRPLALVQTSGGPRWMRVEALLPACLAVPNCVAIR